MKTGTKSLGKIAAGVYNPATAVKALGTKAGRKKLIKKGKEFGTQQAGMAAFGSLTSRGEDYQAQGSPEMPSIGGTRDVMGEDSIKKSSGLTYKTKKNNERKSKKQKAYEMSKKHAGKKGFQEYVDRVFGGKTTIKGSTTYTRKKI